MTYNPNVPNASQSPGVFPAQNNTNFARLKTIINADHVFNDTAAATDGIHKQVSFSLHATPVAGATPVLYAYVDSLGRTQLSFWNGATDFKITPGIVAMVNFNGSGAVGVQVIRSQINVTSVTKVSTGIYTINFTTAMPDNNYIIQVCGYSQNGTNGISNGAIRGDVSYNTAVQTDNVKVQFNGSGSNLIDVTAGCVVVTRVS